MLSFHEFGRGGGFDLAVLQQFGFDEVKRGMRMFSPGASDQRCADCDGVPEPDSQLRGHGTDIMCKQAMRHDAVEQGGGDAAVEDAGVALERRIARKDRLDAAVGAKFRAQL